jgi:hypothetical protein
MALTTGSASLSVVTTRSERTFRSAHSCDKYGQVCWSQSIEAVLSLKASRAGWSAPARAAAPVVSAVPVEPPFGDPAG